MRKKIRIVALTFLFFFISIISFQCTSYEYVIYGIDLRILDKNREENDVYTKESEMEFHVETKYNDFKNYTNASSSSYAFYDPGEVVLNPIDTTTMKLYSSSIIIINYDTLPPKTNLLENSSFKESLHTYNDFVGGYHFYMKDNFHDDLRFVYNSDSTSVFTFKAETIDQISLFDSVKIKLDWN
ncbi:MAG: hypothetical protein GQ564_10945 [Bacteroidales bacterium]|nr:hypothetical protein [Bacteroidales bacterium]